MTRVKGTCPTYVDICETCAKHMWTYVIHGLLTVSPAQGSPTSCNKGMRCESPCPSHLSCRMPRVRGKPRYHLAVASSCLPSIARLPRRHTHAGRPAETWRNKHMLIHVYICIHMLDIHRLLVMFPAPREVGIGKHVQCHLPYISNITQRYHHQADQPLQLWVFGQVCINKGLEVVRLERLRA